MNNIPRIDESKTIYTNQNLYRENEDSHEKLETKVDEIANSSLHNETNATAQRGTKRARVLVESPTKNTSNKVQRTRRRIAVSSRHERNDASQQLRDLAVHYRYLKNLAKAREPSIQDLITPIGRRGITALHMAAIEGHLEVIKALLEAAGEETRHLLNARDKIQSIPLHWAAMQKDPEIVKILLEAVGDRKMELLLARDEDGDTPLHNAASLGMTGVVISILEAAGEQKEQLILAENSKQNTPLDSAVDSKKTNIIHILLHAAGERSPELFKGKDIAVILYPKKTDGAFDTDDTDFEARVEQLSETYWVYVAKPDNIEDAYQKVKDLKEKSGRDIVYLELAGHGNQFELVWNEEDTEGGGISVTQSEQAEEELRKLLNLTDKNCVIATQSCKNGLESEDENLLQYLARFAQRGQRVVGSAGSSNTFTIHNTKPLHFTYNHASTSRDITKIWYCASDGTPVEISSKHFEDLWNMFDRDERAIELIYQYLGEKDNLGTFIATCKALQKIESSEQAADRIIRKSKNVTLRKGSLKTEWIKLLNDLEGLAAHLGANTSNTEIQLTPEMREGKVEEGDDEGLFITSEKNQSHYQKVYKAVLGIAAIEKFKYGIVLFDNGESFFKNPAAQMIYAMTGQVIHSDSNSITSLVLSMGNISELVLHSYQIAKEKNCLLHWFQEAFEDGCFNGLCASLSEYHSSLISEPGVEAASSSEVEDDNIEKLYLGWITDEMIQEKGLEWFFYECCSEYAEETSDWVKSKKLEKIARQIRFICSFTRENILEFAKEEGFNSSLLDELSKYLERESNACYSIPEIKEYVRDWAIDNLDLVLNNRWYIPLSDEEIAKECIKANPRAYYQILEYFSLNMIDALENGWITYVEDD